MPRPRVPEDRLWEAAARLILPHYLGPRVPVCREVDITWLLGCWRGRLPGHPALRLLEDYRAWRRGEREALDDSEVSILMLKLLEIALTVV